jgi:hypothetical protein
MRFVYKWFVGGRFTSDYAGAECGHPQEHAEKNGIRFKNANLPAE